MTYIVHIKHNKTGEVRKCYHEGEFSEFMWLEGNYSCDCNLHDEFIGFSEPWKEFPCGEAEYSVTDVHGESGERDEEMKRFLGMA
jgi:hypothetical protein